jgi:aminopeptidase N
LESSRPIDFQVNTPDEINQMFDAISYEKGKNTRTSFVHFESQN